MRGTNIFVSKAQGIAASTTKELLEVKVEDSSDGFV